MAICTILVGNKTKYWWAYSHLRLHTHTHTNYLVYKRDSYSHKQGERESGEGRVRTL